MSGRREFAITLIDRSARRPPGSLQELLLQQRPPALSPCLFLAGRPLRCCCWEHCEPPLDATWTRSVDLMTGMSKVSCSPSALVLHGTAGPSSMGLSSVGRCLMMEDADDDNCGCSWKEPLLGAKRAMRCTSRLFSSPAA